MNKVNKRCDGCYYRSCFKYNDSYRCNSKDVCKANSLYQERYICEYCEGTGLLGFQLESCWFCSGKGYIIREVNDNEVHE